MQKHMSLNDFKEEGWLQEINRRILHPAGLALVMQVDDETEEVSFHGVVDNRSETGGMVFNLDKMSEAEIKTMVARADRVERQLKNHRIERLFLYGTIIQTLKKCVGMLNFKGWPHENE